MVLGRAVVAVLGLLAGLLAPFVAATAASSAAEGSDTAERKVTAKVLYQTTAFATTNLQRRQHDRVRLRHHLCLQRFANRQARAMAEAGEIYHQPLRPVLRRCNLRLTGENVASGFDSGKSVVLDGWMKSPDHRANILEPRYRRMAVGAHRGADGRWYVAQLFGARS